MAAGRRSRAPLLLLPALLRQLLLQQQLAGVAHAAPDEAEQQVEQGPDDADPGSTGTAAAEHEDDLEAIASLKRLTLKADLSAGAPVFLDFEGEDGAGTLLEAGTPELAFSCGDASVPSDLAHEGASVDMRRFTLEHASQGFLNQMSNTFSSQSDPPILIRSARLNVPNASDDSPLAAVHFENEDQPPSDVLNDISVDEEFTMSVVYACRSQGETIVELLLVIAGKAGGPGEPVCLRWIKNCAEGFGDLVIKEGDEAVYETGAIDEDWQARMQNVGTHDSVTKLSVASGGVQLFQPPIARSNQKLLRVEVRGPFYLSNIVEVGKEPVSFSIVYTCEYDGHADVTVVLRKAAIGDVSPQELTLRWRKHCGSTPYTALTVGLRSDAFGNRTEVVSGGETLRGYVRPCANDFAPGDQCGSTGDLGLEIPPRDSRTMLEFAVVGDGTVEPPTFLPMPDLTYDRRVMQATIIQSPRLVSSSGKGSRTRGGGRDKLQNMVIKYTCFKDSVSTVMVTIHVLAHKPIDIAWRKRCVEPKAKRGKALTAPQALLIAMFVLGVILLTSVLVCYFCSDRDPTLRAYQGVNGHDTSGRSSKRSIELAAAAAAARSGRREPSASPLGARQAPDEVVFH
eukprot:TRINITY_DN23739_c0_g1_i2.p1 TRINITY_DN23739_c0_g1~~TRINITY_DN23739_c0_g1_i2.p1  ORF type:complete len:641 (+),score=164.32 TRINITY_DN23739_c0_g1_i2:50-1924(+)